MDYYSDFIEVRELPDTTSSSVIQFFKEQFSRHGIPDCLIMTDNGSQIVSQEFTQFTTDWEFKHVTSSPRYPKSNGKAESAVKIVMNLFKKALKDDKDPWLALLDYRNTPTEGQNSSPTQRLMSRRTRTRLPTASSLLHPRVIEVVDEKIKQKKQTAKYYHDRTAKTLPDIEVGQEVRVAPLERNQPWKSGTCLQKLTDRSYLVKTAKETLRRKNRQSLKPAPLSQPERVHRNKESSGSNLQLQSAEQETPTCPETIDAEQPSVPSVKPQSLPTPDKEPDVVAIHPKVLRTRTRIVNPPARYRDFVNT